mmetsp:Transcript_58434/g.170896  ORF Transcript_58434/g.170896 Transcript_58434/m.170896 type:complete len:214 (-) Transcript_58434:147-788(-)
MQRQVDMHLDEHRAHSSELLHLVRLNLLDDRHLLLERVQRFFALPCICAGAWGGRMSKLFLSPSTAPWRVRRHGLLHGVLLHEAALAPVGLLERLEVVLQGLGVGAVLADALLRLHLHQPQRRPQLLNRAVQCGTARVEGSPLIVELSPERLHIQGPRHGEGLLVGAVAPPRVLGASLRLGRRGSHVAHLGLQLLELAPNVAHSLHAFFLLLD